MNMSETEHMVNMTASETEALKQVMLANFDACACLDARHIPMPGWPGRTILREAFVCPGHKFLLQPNIVERLLWVRRTREVWQAEEHMLDSQVVDEEPPIPFSDLPDVGTQRGPQTPELPW